MFELTISGDDAPSWLEGTIYSFCVELDQFIARKPYKLMTAQEYFEGRTGDAVEASNTVDALEKLISSMGTFTDSSFASQVDAALFQASVWELSYDYTLPGDLTDGTFKINNPASDANKFLLGADSYTGPIKYQLFVLENGSKQDQLVWKAVSAPSMLALIALSLGLIAWRRKRA